MTTIREFDNGARRYGLDETVADLITRTDEELAEYLRMEQEATKQAQRAGRDYDAWIVCSAGRDTLVYSDGRTVRG